jgi:DNA processing protein
MNDRSEALLRRRAIAARAPGMTAPRLTAIAAASPDLALLGEPDETVLGQLGLSTDAVGWFAAPDLARIEADLRWLADSGATLLAVTDDAYPELLRQSPDAPPLLFVLGDPGALAEPQIAMVGSRNPTAGGVANARSFASKFARAGITVTSGLALGIDAACH